MDPFDFSSHQVPSFNHSSDFYQPMGDFDHTSPYEEVSHCQMSVCHQRSRLRPTRPTPDHIPPPPPPSLQPSASFYDPYYETSNRVQDSLWSNPASCPSRVGFPSPSNIPPLSESRLPTSANPLDSQPFNSTVNANIDIQHRGYNSELHSLPLPMLPYQYPHSSVANPSPKPLSAPLSSPVPDHTMIGFNRASLPGSSFSHWRGPSSGEEGVNNQPLYLGSPIHMWRHSQANSVQSPPTPLTASSLGVPMTYSSVGMDGMLATHMPVSTDEGEAYSMMKSILMPSSASFGPSDYGMPPVPHSSHPTPMTSYDPGLISSAHAHYQQRHANNILSSTVPFPLEDHYPHDNHDGHEHHEPTDDEDEDEIMDHIDTNRSNKIVKGNGSVPVGKTFQCPICLRIYPRVGRQEACINKHNGDKKYPCKGKCGVLDCPKAFYGMEDLRRHLRPLEKKRWKCPNCHSVGHLSNRRRHEGRCPVGGVESLFRNTAGGSRGHDEDGVWWKQ